MRSLIRVLLSCLTTVLLPFGCVDPFDQNLYSTLDAIVVDGTITNLHEPQLVRLNRSKADPLTGRFGTSPITKAAVEVVVDSGQVIALREVEAGRYQAPDGFIGQIGHSYTLRLTLSNGIQYESTAEVMQAVPEIGSVNVRFNATSLSSVQQLKGGYAAAHDFYVSWNDPADQHNYYRWDWIDWERQEWCKSCQGGLYQIYNAQGSLVEDCVNDRFMYPNYDYNCRTKCWEIIYSNDLTIFDDSYSNGNPIVERRIGQVPLYSKEHCLVEIRQNALTAGAYTYFKKLLDQTQNTGGVADTPSSVPAGNVRNLTNPSETVVGYFTASAISSMRYWLTRRDAAGFYPGLFEALHDGRLPVNEQSTARYRPPLAVCVQSDSRTPNKPQGWQD